MSAKINRTLQGLILLGLGWLLFERFFTGELYYYINERFFDLVIIAAVGFLVLGFVVLAYRRDHSHHHHDNGPAHEHHHHKSGSRWAIAIVSIPLLLGFIIPSKPLDSNVIQSRGISNDAFFISNPNQEALELSAPADQRNILDWVRAFNYSEDPREFAGQTADVIGFVYHDPRLPDHQFLVSRLTVTCCVADAFAIGMVVDWPQAAEMADNAWVHVRGEVQTVELEGRTLPLIIADSIKDTDPPAQPYLFP